MSDYGRRLMYRPDAGVPPPLVREMPSCSLLTTTLHLYLTAAAAAAAAAAVNKLKHVQLVQRSPVHHSLPSLSVAASFCLSVPRQMSKTKLDRRDISSPS